MFNFWYENKRDKIKIKQGTEFSFISRQEKLIIENLYKYKHVLHEKN